MSKKKHKISRSLALIGALALLVAASSLPAAPPLWAAPARTLNLAATHDTYTDINLPATNLDDGLLNAANSPGAPQQPDVTTKQVWLAFDLSGVDFPIERAVLRLSTLTCGGLIPADAVAVTVYGVDNAAAWAEDTLTWETQAAVSTGALAGLDAGETAWNQSQTYTWTDDGQGVFATWLETQRGANDGRATLVLAIDNVDGPGIADLFFQDREGTGAVYGCADSAAAPALEVSNTSAAAAIYLPVVSR